MELKLASVTAPPSVVLVRAARIPSDQARRVLVTTGSPVEFLVRIRERRRQTRRQWCRS